MAPILNQKQLITFTCPEADLPEYIRILRQRAGKDSQLKPGFGVSVYRTIAKDTWVRCLGTVPISYQQALQLQPYCENELPFKLTPVPRKES